MVLNRVYLVQLPASRVEAKVSGKALVTRLAETRARIVRTSGDNDGRTGGGGGAWVTNSLADGYIKAAQTIHANAALPRMRGCATP